MRRLLSVFISSVILPAAHADVFYVDIDAPPNGDGSHWNRAFDSLTDALAAAGAGDQIWVAGGTYKPSTPGGNAATFTIPDGVQVYGGFQGNESTLAQRGDPLSPLSQLDGGELSYHVVTMSNVGPGTVLDGFQIRLGNADAGGTTGLGAGLYATDSAPTIRNVHFLENSANIRGGGAYLGGSPASFATFIDCVFEDNSSGLGSAIYSEVPTTVQSCEFEDNSDGPAFYITGDSIQTIDDSTFHQNTGGQAGAIRVAMDPGGSSIISDCQFTLNNGSLTGGIYYNSYGNHELRSSRFMQNHGDSRAGAVTAQLFDGTSSSVRIENSLFTGNTSDSVSGAIVLDFDGDLDIINSTIVGNTSATGIGGGVICTKGTARISNSILWGNQAGTSTAQQRQNLWYNAIANVSANRSIIQYLGLGISPPSGANNSNTDPLFVDADGNDNSYGTNDDNVQLMPGSPAIDAGSNLYVGPSVFTDIYGNTRFADDTGTPDTGDAGGLPPVVDIGAAEFQGTTPSDCLADTNGDGMLSPADFSAWVAAFNTMAPQCDQNNDGACSPADFSAWVANYNAGC